MRCNESRMVCFCRAPPGYKYVIVQLFFQFIQDRIYAFKSKRRRFSLLYVKIIALDNRTAQWVGYFQRGINCYAGCCQWSPSGQNPIVTIGLLSGNSVRNRFSGRWYASCRLVKTFRYSQDLPLHHTGGFLFLEERCFTQPQVHIDLSGIIGQCPGTGHWWYPILNRDKIRGSVLLKPVW